MPRQRQADPRTTYSDMPLVVDHWRYFASVVRAKPCIHSMLDTIEIPVLQQERIVFRTST
jgi:hypothetical protein